MDKWDRLEQEIKDDILHDLEMSHPAIPPTKYYRKARCQRCGCVQGATRDFCLKCKSYDLEDFFETEPLL